MARDAAVLSRPLVQRSYLPAPGTLRTPADSPRPRSRIAGPARPLALGWHVPAYCAGCRGCRADLCRDRLHDGGAALPRHQAAGDRDPGPVRDSVLLGIGRLLDRDHGIFPAPVRSRSLRHLGHGRPECTDRLECAHRHRHADLQRGCRARLRRATRDLRVAVPHGRAASFRFLRVERHQPAGCAHCGEAGLAGPMPCPGRVRTRVLSMAPASDQAQERQHRRFLPPLGTQLPLHGDTRCRQRDERRVSHHPGAADGGQSRTPASFRPRRVRPEARPSTPGSSSSRIACTGRSSSLECISSSSAKRTTGATTPSSVWLLSCSTARWPACPGAGRCPATSCRTTSSRRR